MASTDKTNFEEDDADSDLSSTLTSSSDLEFDTTEDIIDVADESTSDFHEEDQEEPIEDSQTKSSPTASTSAETTINTPSTDSPALFISQKPTKSKKSSMTRLQENDLLLSIYDALSAYRRPSSKPSLDRKLDSIEHTISLLQKLRDQLTLQPSPSADIPGVRSKPSSSPSPSSSSSSSKSSSSSSKVPKPSLKSKSVEKPSKLPTSPFHVFCADRRKEMSSESLNLSAAAIRAKMKAEWKEMSAARLEVFASRFVIQTTGDSPTVPISSYSQFISNLGPVMKASLFTDHRKADEGCKLPESLPPVYFTAIQDVVIPAKKFYWTLRNNLHLAGKGEHSAEGAVAVKAFAAFRTECPSIPFSSVHISRNGKRMVVADTLWAHVYDIVREKPGDQSNVTDLSTKHVASIPITSHNLLARSLYLSADGSTLYVGDGDSFLKKWNLQTKEIEEGVSTHKGHIFAISISHDGKWIASASEDRSIMVYDASSLTPWRRFGNNGDKRLGPKDAISCVAFSPNNVHLACGSLDTSVRVWNVASGELVARFDGHEKAVMGISWRDEYDLVSVSLDSSLKYWSLLHAKVPLLQKTPGEQVAVAFDPINGRAMWTAGKEKVMRLWFPRIPSESNGTEPKSSNASEEQSYAAITGFTAPVVDIAVARFEETTVVLASITSDGLCALWSYTTN